MRTLIYTVNLNDYDDLQPYEFNGDKDCRCVVFTYNKNLKVKGWETFVVEPKKDILKHSREIKLCVDRYIKDFDKCIYVDASYTIKRSLVAYMDRYYTKGLLLHDHPNRVCTYSEARRVIDIGADIKENVYPQMQKYSSGGLKENMGLSQNGFFIRDFNSSAFMAKWYAEVESGSYRDQLSIGWCILKHKDLLSRMQKIKPTFIASFLKNNPHKKKRDIKLVISSTAKKVWYFTPGRGDKNLGRAYNEHCALVPDGDWICIMDGDVLFLNPFWPKQIEDIIEKHGNDYPLISCLTNRLGLVNQLPYGFSNDPNILNHAKISDEHFEKYYDEVYRTTSQTAGLFMLFPKSTWNKVKFKPGLTNGGTFVDFSFADTVMKELGFIGIARGIYLFHFYRFNKKKTYIEHLKD